MNQQLKRAVSLCSAAAIVSSATPALAYGYDAHSRIVEEAVYVLQVDVQNPANAAAPAGVSQSDWDSFIATAKTSASALSVLQTGLPHSKPVGESHPLLQINPFDFDTPSDEGFPFNGSEDFNCAYNTNDNLANAGLFRVADFHYTVQRSAPCALAAVTDTSRPLQSVLGWHAGTVDDHLQDTVLWYRPTNSVLVTFIAHIASQAVALVAGAILLPFVCLFKFFSGGSCNDSDGQDLVNQVNPVGYIEGLIPGFGNIYDGDYTGLWHFINVGASAGDYNDMRGMLYEFSGDDHPGVVDVGIMALSDVSGLSLKPLIADGDDNYGKYDRLGRNYFTWQATSIGHLEWSPVDHLAAYGWDRFKANRTSIDGLGWVLHALGDAGEPHHVTGTTSWGHRPYEDYVNDHKATLLLLAPGDTTPPVAAADYVAQHRRVLEIAYKYFKILPTGSQPADVVPIESLVQQAARDTYLKVHLQSWPFDDGASLEYLGDKPEATAAYNGQDAHMMDVIETSVGASIAFLMYAGKFASDPGISPNTACPANTHFVPPTTCAPGASAPPPVVLDLGDGGLCSSNAVCGVDAGPPGTVPTGGICTSSADCVVGTCIAGVCSKDCTTQACAKGTCSGGTSCCAEASAPCLVNADCCDTCFNGVCQPPIVP